MSADPRANLLDHPLRTAATTLAANCTLDVNFRTYDPETRTTKPLQFARVNLVPSTGASYAAETNQDGDLVAAGLATALVVSDLQNLPEGVEFHFEVVGPVNPTSSDLTAMSYPVGNGSRPFPIAAWSTKGWKEPEGHWGHFKLSNTKFPAKPPKLSFTVGCYVNAPVKYVRSKTRETCAVPSNIKLSLVHNAVPRPVAIRSGGILSDVFFDIVPNDVIEVHGTIDADAITADNITAIDGNLTVTGNPINDISGALFGFKIQQSIKTVNLYQNYQFSDALLKGTLLTLNPTVSVDDLAVLFAIYADSILPDQRICLCYNWFVEFVADRNLFVRVFKKLLSSTSLQAWNGFAPLTLKIDDSPGQIGTSSATVIEAHLEYILDPDEFSTFHELAHALADEYFPDERSKIYFPSVTTSHNGSSYSNEFFAFSEGFPGFIASLFIDPEIVYERTNWRVLDTIHLGFSDPELNITVLETSAGLAVEDAFAASLTALWTDKIWSTRSPKPDEQPWVQDPIGDGTLDVQSAGSVNSWLLNAGVQNGFARYIFDAIGASVKVIDGDGRYSTRRIVDEIQNRAVADALWSATPQFFADLKVVNEFYISAILVVNAGSSIVWDLVVRSDPNSLLHSTSLNAQALYVNTFYVGDTHVIQLQGIRIPPTPNMSVKLVHDVSSAAVAATTVAWTSQHRAEATFTTLTELGMYNLVVTAPTASYTVSKVVELAQL